MVDLSNRFVVFIGGLHRSGTTLLHDLLAVHPDTSGFHGTGVPANEGQHLQQVLPTARQHGGPGRFAFHPDASITEHSALATERDRHKLHEQWSRHWDLESPVLLEKSPPNLLRGRYLAWAFPQAAFIVVVRHPLAVALATEKWCRQPLRRHVRHWCMAHQGFLEHAPYLRRLLVVRYEELVSSPKSVLIEVHRFLGLREVPPSTAHVSAEGNDRYFSAWETSWRRKPWNFWESRYLQFRFGRTFATFGYNVRDLVSVGPPGGKGLPCGIWPSIAIE